MTETKITQITLRDELARLAARLKESRTDAAATAAKMRTLMAMAHEAGISYNELERVTGLAAETVRRWAEPRG